MDIGNVARLVTFLLPGFVAIQVRDVFIRSRERDNFERTASSVFVSLAAYVSASGITWAFHREAGWRAHTTVHFENWPFVVLLFVIAIAFGYLSACLTMWKGLQGWLFRHGLDVSQHPNVWNEIWDCPGEAPWVLVRMKDGTECWGQVRAYSRDPDDNQRELWLHPVARGEIGQPPKEVIPGLSIYIPGDQIVTVSAYRPADQPEE